MQSLEHSLADLLEHLLGIDVDPNERVIVAIDVGEIAVGAAARAAIRDGHKFEVRCTADAPAKATIETPEEGGGFANHQCPLAGRNRMSAATSGGRSKTLSIYDLYTRLGNIRMIRAASGCCSTFRHRRIVLGSNVPTVSIAVSIRKQFDHDHCIAKREDVTCKFWR
jgi:hypothetical protein